MEYSLSLNMFVSECILAPETAEERAKILKFFREVCLCLVKKPLYNYYSSGIIYGSLDSSPVYRLSRTHAVLEDDPGLNFFFPDYFLKQRT